MKSFRILLILIFVFTGVNVSTAQDKNIKELLGTWDVETGTAGYGFVFTFSMEADSLIGVYNGTSGDTRMQDLIVEKNEVSFAVIVGGRMEIAFAFKHDKGKFTGGLEMMHGESEIVGERRKEKKKHP